MINLDIDYISVWSRICGYCLLPDAKAHVSSTLQKQIMCSLPLLAYCPSNTTKYKKSIKISCQIRYINGNTGIKLYVFSLEPYLFISEIIWNCLYIFHSDSIDFIPGMPSHSWKRVYLVDRSKKLIQYWFSIHKILIW